MMFSASSELTQSLIKLPESGLGYQFISATNRNDWQSHRYIVYNAELLLDLDSSLHENFQKLRQHKFKATLANARPIDLSPSSLHTISWTDRKLVFIRQELQASNKGRHSGKVGAKAAPVKSANGLDKYVRLSAFENDKRIDVVNRCLLPGSFTTTEEDYRTCVRLSDYPNDRYALPNDEKILWAFYIRPTMDDKVQIGVAQPDFGKNGGGIEAYFDKGTKPHTYLDKTEYGNFL